MLYDDSLRCLPCSADVLIWSGLESSVPSVDSSLSFSRSSLPSCNEAIRDSSISLFKSCSFVSSCFTASISTGNEGSWQAISNALILSTQSSARLYRMKIWLCQLHSGISFMTFLCINTKELQISWIIDYSTVEKHVEMCSNRIP